MRKPTTQQRKRALLTTTALCLFSDKAPQFKNMAVRRRLGSKFGPKFLDILPPVKRGARWVECLWIFYEHRQRRHSFCSTGGRLTGRLSSISSRGKKIKPSSKIYRPPRPADAGPGGLNNTTFV